MPPKYAPLTAQTDTPSDDEDSNVQVTPAHVYSRCEKITYILFYGM
jgi:hypothetical protein